MSYKIILTQVTPVINLNATDYSDVLNPGTYELVEITNPFNREGAKKIENWLALNDARNIGQIRCAWEQYPWVKIEKI